MQVSVIDLSGETSCFADTYASEGETVPINTRKHIAEYFDSKREIVVYGGRPNEFEARYDNQLYSLSVDSMQWRKLRCHGRQPVNTQSSHMSCVDPARNRMFIYAVLERDEDDAQLYEFDYNGRIPFWTLIRTTGKIPIGIYGGKIDLVNGDTILLYGGVVNEIYRSDIYKFDVKSKAWTEITQFNRISNQSVPTDIQAPRERARHDSIVRNGKVLYFGGEPYQRVTLFSVLELHY